MSRSLLCAIGVLCVGAAGCAAPTIKATTSGGACGGTSDAGDGPFHALIVANSAYAPDSGFSSLRAYVDAKRVYETLTALVFGGDLRRSERRVCVVSDASAPRIELELTRLAARVREGDSAVFYYSGHGARLTDDDGDEADGLDEVLVGISAQGTSSFLRDDALDVATRKVRRALGPRGHLLVVLDACHSGTGTRHAVARSGSPKGHPTRPGPPGVRRGESRAFDAVGPGHDRLASLAVLSAAQPNQEAFEDSDGGVFTRALVGAIASGPPTYRDLLQSVDARIGAAGFRQTPMAEGELDLEPLSGARTGADAVLRVSWVPRLGRHAVWAGTFAGVASGGRYALEGGALGSAEACVERVEASRAILAACSGDEAPAPRAWSGMRAELVERGLSLGRLVLDASAVGLPDGVRERVLELRHVSLAESDQPANVLLVGSPERGFELRGPDGRTVLASMDTLGATGGELARQLELVSLRRYLLDLELDDPTLAVRLRVIAHPEPGHTCTSGTTREDFSLNPAAFRRGDGTLVLADHHTYGFEIENASKGDAYYALVAFPEGEAPVLLHPKPGMLASESTLGEAQARVFVPECVAGAGGAERGYRDVFKLFVSRSPLEFDHVFGAGPLDPALSMRRGSVEETSASSLAGGIARDLLSLQEGVRLGVHRVDASSVRRAGGTTHAVVVEVVPAHQHAACLERQCPQEIP